MKNSKPFFINELTLADIIQHQSLLSCCQRCPSMFGPVIIGNPTIYPIMSVGQAPGGREGALQKPFAWTAGKTLFQWFESIGVSEECYREHVYMAAVCRCFPGKNKKGSGDRVPSKLEIAQCGGWLEREYHILQPRLIIPIGRLAIEQYLRFKTLTDVVGQQHRVQLNNRWVDIIPLPHPSGLSTWFRADPGKTLLYDALQLLKTHTVWLQVFQSDNV